MEVLKDVSSIIASISITIGAIVGILQLVKFVKSTKADHERKQKQSTLEFSHTTWMETRDLLKKMREAGIIDGDVPLDDTVKVIINNDGLEDVVSRYLNLMNRLSVGVITKVYDITIYNQIAGRSGTNIYDSLEPYIKYKRHKIKRGATLWCDFEQMIDEIKILNGITKSNPAILEHSPLTIGKKKK